ncbi:Uridine diphosphate glucose pyrophosphatase [Melipona quadrifasciata]|uniref:Uridine diphosphate glucose pyrophosphatase n=1 Tax=Melipona quadrifasciata TaxID=166423 RepID=A0A0M9A6R1_9HYME|nr:Uridine diphosphate glucose pyrophosphatase [Melipona quadrifasciata]
MDIRAQEKQNENIRQRMLDVQQLRITECPSDSPWIRPVRIRYQQDGEQRDWDVVRAHDGVKKFGPVDLKQYPPSLGLTLELCAGIVDKDKSFVEIAKDEVREECGYEAPIEAFKYVITFRHVSTSVCKHTLFYVEVTDEMHTHSGGGAASEGELIEVVELSIPEVKQYISSEEVESPPCLLYGVTWFLANKPEHCS